jgi:hypothetical protein
MGCNHGIESVSYQHPRKEGRGVGCFLTLMSMNDSHTVVIHHGVSIAVKLHVGCVDIDFMLLFESADSALQVYE